MLLEHHPIPPDHKTIAEFRKNNGPAIRKVCARFVELCRRLGLLAVASVAIDGSKEERSRWQEALLARRPTNVVLVAMANKTARVVWALLSRREVFCAKA